MRRSFITLLLTVFIVLALSVLSYAKADYKKVNKQTEEIIEKALNQYVEPFMDESIPEEQRILEYHIAGYGTRGGVQEDEIATKFDVEFYVTPVNEENTIWQKRNMIFVDLKYENGEFSIEKIADKPENWDKFLERFEEYKNQNNGNEIIENETKISGKDTEYKNTQIEKISNYIYWIGGAISFIGMGFVLVKLKDAIRK